MCVCVCVWWWKRGIKLDKTDRSCDWEYMHTERSFRFIVGWDNLLLKMCPENVGLQKTFSRPNEQE